MNKKLISLFLLISLTVLALTSTINTSTSQVTNPPALGDWDLFETAYGTDSEQLMFFNTSMLYGGYKTLQFNAVQTIENCNNTARELNTYFQSCAPGGRIDYSCYMWTGPSTETFDPYGAGARIGIDFYGYEEGGNTEDIRRITGVQSDNYPDTPETLLANYVQWGSEEWVFRHINFSIPDTLAADGWAGWQPNGLGVSGGSYVPVGVIMWMQVQHSNDTGLAYFADPEIDITVLQGPTPTPEPTATATPTPEPTASYEYNYTIAPVTTLPYFLILCGILVAFAIIAFVSFPILGLPIGIVGLIVTAWFSQSGEIILSQYTDSNTLVTYYTIMPIGWLVMVPVLLSIFCILIPAIKHRR